jgi:hypothetical protein
LELLPVLVLDMIKIIPPLGKYKYDTWRILLVKCYINNYVCLRSYIRNFNNFLPGISLWSLMRMNSCLFMS